MGWLTLDFGFQADLTKTRRSKLWLNGNWHLGLIINKQRVPTLLFALDWCLQNLFNMIYGNIRQKTPQTITFREFRSFSRQQASRSRNKERTSSSAKWQPDRRTRKGTPKRTSSSKIPTPKWCISWSSSHFLSKGKPRTLP